MTRFSKWSITCFCTKCLIERQMKTQFSLLHKSCIICNNNSKFICCRACITNNFVSLGVAGSRKYVIRLVMFGGLVGFSYCSHFVLITVVWIAPHASVPPHTHFSHPSCFTNDTNCASKHREWNLVVFKISLPPRSVIAGSQDCVYCTGT